MPESKLVLRAADVLADLTEAERAAIGPMMATLEQELDIVFEESRFAELASEIAEEATVFTVLYNGLMILSPIVLATTEKPEISHQTEEVTEWTLGNEMIKQVLQKLLEQTIGHYFRTNPDKTLSLSDITYGQLQAINISPDPQRPICIALTNNSFSPVTNGPSSGEKLILTLAQMKTESEVKLRELHTIVPTFQSSIEKFYLVTDKEQNVARLQSGVAEYLAAIRQSADDIRVQLDIIIRSRTILT